MGHFLRGDYVKYANNGVCLISDICTPDFDKGAGKDAYYVLSPIRDRSTVIFIPRANDNLLAKMKRLLTKNEIDDLILSINKVNFEWIVDRKIRIERFQEILASNDTLEILRMISCICLKKKSLSDAGGKGISLSDSNILEQAEGLIENEFAFVLKIPASEVGDYIREKLSI